MNNRYGKSGWSKGALLNFCIGQGEILVTPMQVFNYVNNLATKGKSYRPHFVKLNTIIENKPIVIDQKHWNRIIYDMGQVVMNSGGTGRSANPNIENLKVFGKTGTAENPHGDDHAWFIGWMEKYNKKFSVVVLYENGGSGGSVAGPIAKKILKK